MNIEHIKDFSSEKLQSFINEKMNDDELECWQNHYSVCQECREYVRECPENKEQFAIDDEVVQELLAPLIRDHCGDEKIWQNIERSINQQEGPLLVIKNSLFEKEISLRAKAAGVSDDLPSKIEIPKEFQLENLAINLKYNDITGNLQLSLNGGSPMIRKKIVLKVFYSSFDTDSFYGKDISIGGVWVIPKEKIKTISRLEFICQDN